MPPRVYSAAACPKRSLDNGWKLPPETDEGLDRLGDHHKHVICFTGGNHLPTMVASPTYMRLKLLTASWPNPLHLETVQVMILNSAFQNNDLILLLLRTLVIPTKCLSMQLATPLSQQTTYWISSMYACKWLLPAVLSYYLSRMWFLKRKTV